MTNETDVEEAYKQGDLFIPTVKAANQEKLIQMPETSLDKERENGSTENTRNKNPYYVPAYG